MLLFFETKNYQYAVGSLDVDVSRLMCKEFISIDMERFNYNSFVIEEVILLRDSTLSTGDREKYKIF